MGYSLLVDCAEANGACGLIRNAKLELPSASCQNLQVVGC